MCEKTEEAAVIVLAAAIRAFVADGNPPSAYDDTLAVEHLVLEGIRPSGLSMDLDDLIACAHRGIVHGRL